MAGEPNSGGSKSPGQAERQAAGSAGTPAQPGMLDASTTETGDFEDAEFDRDFGEVRDDEALIVDVEGFEGPLDLLLALARTHKLDLTRISILALANQYLAFIEEAGRMRLEIAADYLVMAAWLAFLKSKLLLPRPASEVDGPSGEELAALLAFRLQRLSAMRDAAARLLAVQRLGRDVFARGAPEPIVVHRESRYTAELYDLLRAYADQRRRAAHTHVTIRKRAVWSIKEARQRLERMLGTTLEWAPLDQYLQSFGIADEETRRTALASAFGASLEMARDGVVELRQSNHFGPLYVRSRLRPLPAVVETAQE